MSYHAGLTDGFIIGLVIGALLLACAIGGCATGNVGTVATPDRGVVTELPDWWTGGAE